MEHYGMACELVPKMQELISKGEGFWLTVTGYSMTPTLLHLQDQVFITPLSRKPRKHDILLTRLDDKSCLLHRVVSHNSDMLYYRGDNLNYCEGPIGVDRVIGIASQVKHDGKISDINRFYNIKSIVKFKSRRILIFIYKKIKNIINNSN